MPGESFQSGRLPVGWAGGAVWLRFEDSLSLGGASGSSRYLEVMPFNGASEVAFPDVVPEFGCDGVGVPDARTLAHQPTSKTASTLVR